MSVWSGQLKDEKYNKENKKKNLMSNTQASFFLLLSDNPCKNLEYGDSSIKTYIPTHELEKSKQKKQQNCKTKTQ